ncbi:MAG: NAD(P)-dependent glycerol-3-phosphate dehydrogenase [Oscillospiraceae bacterium]|jgi:glycerol-3-phosphate dehydrogenase (NAD(P)+)|nr:NAD(P)-dependent glycerol-3-phosphate dehydrogenase [Oscillospiraceae bacterium]
MANISIMGAGSFGLALAVTLNKAGHNITVWSFAEKEKQTILQERENKIRLPGIRISENINITTDFKDISKADLILISVPSTAVREVARNLKQHITSKTIVANMSKGIEKGSLKGLSAVISEELLGDVVVVHGPSHAEELARDVPTSMVAACINLETAKKVQILMQSKTVNVYISNDVKGLEAGSTLKNIIAIAVGACTKLGIGDNLLAILLTKGLCEIGKLGVAMGGSPQTFVGLSGLGDLLATCLSEHSRNRRLGELIAQKISVREALQKINMVVEGYDNAASIKKWEEKYKLHLPIMNTIYRVLYEGENVEKITDALTEKSGAGFEYFWF